LKNHLSHLKVNQNLKTVPNFKFCYNVPDQIPVITYNRSNSFVIDPIINEWSEKLDNIIKDLVAEDSTPENQLENFTLLEEIINELKSSQADFVSLLHTQLLKKMNFIAFLFEKYYANKEVRISTKSSSHIRKKILDCWI